MYKEEFAQLIDAYADAKTSGNKYLIKKMIVDLENALNQVFGETPQNKALPKDELTQEA